MHIRLTASLLVLDCAASDYSLSEVSFPSSIGLWVYWYEQYHHRVLQYQRPTLLHYLINHELIGVRVCGSRAD